MTNTHMTYDQFDNLKATMTKFFDDPSKDKYTKINKYRSILINQISVESSYRKELITKLDEIKSNVLDDIKKHSNLYDNANEMKIKMNGDPKVCAVQREINQRDIIIEYMLEQNSNLKDYAFALKLEFEYRRFENGD